MPTDQMGHPRQRLTPTPTPWQIRIAPRGGSGESSPSNPTVEAAWRQMLAANDRLHDGPTLAVKSIDAAIATLVCEHSTYRSLATQHHPTVGDRGVRLLGVKGLITGRDRSGREHLLIARRGTQTRIYGGLWELCPGGGIEPPAPEAHGITHDNIAGTLVHEAAEEMGVTLSPADCDPVCAMVMDDEAFSLDLIMPVRWPGVVDPRHGLCGADGCEWEYLDAAWVAIDDVGSFAVKNAAAISPPTLAVWRWRGWAPNGT